MKTPTCLILTGIGVVLLVVVAVFVVPWFGKMFNEMEQIAEQHHQHIHALERSARQPLTVEQETLLSQLFEVIDGTAPSQNPNDLEGTLSSEPYLTYLKTQEGEDYEDFSAYVIAMPTANMKAVGLSRVKIILGSDKSDEDLEIWTNYYFKVREWGTTVQDPRDNMGELHEVQEKHLIEPLTESDAEVEGIHTKIVQIGMSSMFMAEDNNVFQEVWRKRLETHGEREGLLRCAIASPSEFALMRSFFMDMAAFQEWILTRPDPEVQEHEH